MAKMKEHVKNPEKQLSNEEIDNLADSEFKTLVIRMLTELIDLSCKNERRSEGYTKWNKRKYTGNQQWREGNQDSNQWFETKEEINIQLEQNEEIRIQKDEEKLRKFWDNFKHSNIWIIGVPEGEEEEQKIENLFKQIMKENFPNPVSYTHLRAHET